MRGEMDKAAVAFHGCLLGLFLLGLRELLSGFEENRCSMTYMFEYPEYRRVHLPRRVTEKYPAYGLYLYGEGFYAQQTRGLKLSGAPVLFLPGNAGSYKQARSLGSVALRKAENAGGLNHLNVFTLDFNEELVALYGGSLRRQTLFLHESIKAILRLYKDQAQPPLSVVLVGHSMGGVVARALFTLPQFNPALVSLIITQASPHEAPVLPLDPYLLEFYSVVKRHWRSGAENLGNVTVLSVGGGHRDYQVRSGLTALRCSPGDPSKLSLVSTAVPRTWVSTDHLSIVWCKELVLATVRAFFDLLESDSRQFTQDKGRRLGVLQNHFVRHPLRLLEDRDDTSVSFPGSADAWTEVNTLRLFYSTPKEAKVQYFLFGLSGRRRAYSHFHCRSSSTEKSGWLYGCTQKSGSVCLQATDLSWGAELLPAYKVITLKLSDLPSVSHLVIAASNLGGKRFTVECEWLNMDVRAVNVSVPHVMSLGLSVSEVTLNSTGLLHVIHLQHFHQVYQAFRINIVSRCKMSAERLPSVYRLVVPWFREDSFTTASVPSVTEINGMLHTPRSDNQSVVLLHLHTAPGCHYKVSVRSSFPKVLGQVLRFFGPMLPVYIAVGLLLACEQQLRSVARTGRPLDMKAAAGAVRVYWVELLVFLLHLLLSMDRIQEGWSFYSLPLLDSLSLSEVVDWDPVTLRPEQDWTRLLCLLLCILGSTVAFWGSWLLELSLRLLSLILALLHRPRLSRDTGCLRLWVQLLLIASLALLGRLTCGALALTLAYGCYLHRVLLLLMVQRTLRHVMNLAPGDQSGCSRSHAECKNLPVVSELLLQEVTDDLHLHLSFSALISVPVLLSVPSSLHWFCNLRYTLQLQPDPCWPLALPLLTAIVLLINCSTVRLCHSKLLRLTPGLLLPLCVTMVTLSLLHLYRVTYVLCVSLVLLALTCYV